jgi:hypothetical protein
MGHPRKNINFASTHIGDKTGVGKKILRIYVGGSGKGEERRGLR